MVESDIELIRLGTMLAQLVDRNATSGTVCARSVARMIPYYKRQAGDKVGPALEQYHREQAARGGKKKPRTPLPPPAAPNVLTFPPGS